MIKLAWRNIWRNRSRSLITIAAVMFCVFFAIVMRAFQTGVYSHMIDTVMGNYFGYVQLHGKGYWEDQTLENSFEENPELVSRLLENENVEKVVKRLEGFSLVSSGDITKGGMILGILPDEELDGLQLNNRLVAGEYLHDSDHSIVIGKDLAAYLKVTAGDTLFFIGQGYHAQSAYGKYHIKGVVNMQNPEFNKSMVLMPLPEAQWMFACEGRLTTLALKLPAGEDYNALSHQFRNDSMVVNGMEILTWEELFPDVIQGIKADSAGGQIIIFVLYLIIGFVLLGTVIMMVAERQVEFGILVSIGMQKSILARITVLENIILSLLGGLLGIALARPIQLYFFYNPIRFGEELEAAMEDYGYEAIMPASTDWSIGLVHGTIVVALAILVSLYAVAKIKFLKPVEAIRP